MDWDGARPYQWPFTTADLKNWEPSFGCCWLRNRSLSLTSRKRGLARCYLLPTAVLNSRMRADSEPILTVRILWSVRQHSSLKNRWQFCFSQRPVSFQMLEWCLETLQSLQADWVRTAYLVITTKCRWTLWTWSASFLWVGYVRHLASWQKSCQMQQAALLAQWWPGVCLRDSRQRGNTKRLLWLHRRTVLGLREEEKLLRRVQWSVRCFQTWWTWKVRLEVLIHQSETSSELGRLQVAEVITTRRHNQFTSWCDCTWCRHCAMSGWGRHAWLWTQIQSLMHTTMKEQRLNRSVLPHKGQRLVSVRYWTERQCDCQMSHCPRCFSRACGQELQLWTLHGVLAVRSTVHTPLSHGQCSGLWRVRQLWSSHPASSLWSAKLGFVQRKVMQSKSWWNVSKHCSWSSTLRWQWAGQYHKRRNTAARWRRVGVWLRSHSESLPKPGGWHGPWDARVCCQRSEQSVHHVCWTGCASELGLGWRPRGGPRSS